MRLVQFIRANGLGWTEYTSESEFMEKMLAGDLFLEMEAYGQRSAFSRKSLCENKYYISELYYKNMENLNSVFNNCIFILIKPKDIETLKSFLFQRNENDKEKVRRIKEIEEEAVCLELLRKQSAFDMVFINNYDQDSEKHFIKLIASLLQK